MLGIIATIVAAKRHHYTFAWIVGIWTGIALILAFTGNASIAIAPGWLFLAIALCMKKKEEVNGNEVLPSETPGSDEISALPGGTTANSSVPAITAGESAAVQSETEGAVERVVLAPPALRFCRYCGLELEQGAKFCRHCGVRLEE